MQTKACDCGCGVLIPALSATGEPRKYLQGHQNRRRIEIPTRLCECGCGLSMPSKDRKGRARRFIKGHHAGQPGSVNALAIYRGNRTGVEPWNKGKSYLIAKRAIYATRGTWMRAMRRLFGDGCMRCGWSDAPCDVHHIVERANGGLNTIQNGVILCPNCHRMCHVGKISERALADIRAAAVEITSAI